MNHRIGFAIVTTLLCALCTPILNGQDWVAPDSAKAVVNPVPDSPEARKAGSGVYAQYCDSCHGKTGRGDGTSGLNLTPKPNDLTDPKLNSQSDGEMFWKLSTGRNAMLPFKGVLTETQRWDLIVYLRTLAPKASPDAKKVESKAVVIKGVNTIDPVNGEKVDDKIFPIDAKTADGKKILIGISSEASASTVSKDPDAYVEAALANKKREDATPPKGDGK